MQFYCPTEANPGTGLQKAVDNFMTINGIWSREHHGGRFCQHLPPSRTFRALWVMYLLLQAQGGVQRRKVDLRSSGDALGTVVTGLAFTQPFLSLLVPI